MINGKKGIIQMEKTKKRRTFKQIAKDKNIEISVKRYLIDALSFMASGLFASLLISTIFNTLGQNLGISLFTDVINPLAKQVTGPAIAVAIAFIYCFLVWKIQIIISICLCIPRTFFQYLRRYI